MTPKAPAEPDRVSCLRCRGEMDKVGLANNHQGCSSCRGRARLNRRARYNERLQDGLCPGCAGPRDLAGIQCSDCRSRNRVSQTENRTTGKATAYQNAYIARNRARGTCGYCGGRLEPGYRMCASCRQRRREVYQRDPIGHRLRALRRGYYKPRPSPLCVRCHTAGTRCIPGCGKMTAFHHQESGCYATCKCGRQRAIEIGVGSAA